MTVQQQRVFGSTTEVGFEIQRLVQEGWEIDPNDPLTAFGPGTLECGLTRDPDAEQLQRDAEARSRRSRAEILADARAAKALKRKETEATTPTTEEQNGI